MAGNSEIRAIVFEHRGIAQSVGVYGSAANAVELLLEFILHDWPRILAVGGFKESFNQMLS